MPNKILDILKSRYEKKYVLPLIVNFPTPLIMFDDFQIRLRKQIESILFRLDEAEICPICKGKGIVFFKNKKHNLTTWDDPILDLRAVRSQICLECLGDGLIFGDVKINKDNEEYIVAKTGSYIGVDSIDKLSCEMCKQYMEFVWDKDSEDPAFKSECHGRTYSLKPEVFSLSVSLKEVKGKNPN